MDPTLLQRLWPVFVEEAREHLQEIGAGVLELEKGAAKEGLLHAIRRTAHGLKGSASSLGFADLERIAHAIESALAGRAEKDGLEAARVEALLAAVDAAEEALRRGDTGHDPSVENLDGVLAALSSAAAASSTSSSASSSPSAGPEREPSALEQVWPVFRTEAGEHVAKLQRALATAHPEVSWGEADPEALVHIAASLRSSACVLGAGQMESRAKTVQEQLIAAGARPTSEHLESLRASVAALEHALGPVQAVQAVQAEHSPEAPRAATEPAADASLMGIFRQEAVEVLQTLEQTLQVLCSPSTSQERTPRVEEAVRRAHNLKGSAGAVGAGDIAARAARLQATLSRMGEPGMEASRAAAAAAEELVGLQQAVASFGQAVTSAVEPEHEPEPEQEAAARSAQAPVGAAVDRTIRVSVSTLESVARQVEGFTLLRAREERRAREVAAQAAALQDSRALCQRAIEEIRQRSGEVPVEALDEAVTRLRGQERTLSRVGQEQIREAEQIRLLSTVVREDLRDLRMVPASTALEPLRRTVREVAGRVGKPVELTLRGGEVRLDRRILDELKEPLQHLVRNAIDHGIEAPEARRAAGKRPAGALEVRVERRGHRIAVIVADDGAGISAERVRRAAVRRGQLAPQAAAQLSDEEALRLVFKAGFSTAEQVTSISGRGVGLDVVQAAAHRLRGTADVSTEPGKGSRFELDLPLTLAATLAVVVRAGADLAALPYEAVERILRLTSKDMGTVAGRASVRIEDAQVPFSSLAQVVGAVAGRLPLEGDRPQPAVLINSGGTRLVFAVDQVVGQHEVVVQSLGRHLARTAHLAGAAVLDDGRVVSVLNAAELMRLARPMSKASEEEDQQRILVVDDSLTTRSAMKAILEIAGYQVLPASDGEEALALLKQTRCRLVVTDVQMPRMDGLTLTRNLKADPALSRLPVIVVTSLDSPSDRAAGLEAGADGYLVKRDVERGKLLELVRQLMPERG
ncbi:MAG: Hpt domain-containing protein [Deltaproteobacteria bacterium]|nr:Hpt domain-containing protein [Deltaproteobacteria bacterium]